MKVASYNIHKCKGADRSVRPDRIVEVIGEIGADVVALQEVDRRFGQKGGLLDPETILRQTGMQLLVQSDAPHRHGWRGNALLVRGEPQAYRRSRLKLPDWSRAARSSPRWTSARGSSASSPLISGCFVSPASIRPARSWRRSWICRRCRPSCSATSTMAPPPSFVARRTRADLRRRSFNPEFPGAATDLRAGSHPRLAEQPDRRSRRSRHAARPTSLRSSSAGRDGEHGTGELADAAGGLSRWSANAAPD